MILISSCNFRDKAASNIAFSFSFKYCLQILPVLLYPYAREVFLRQDWVKKPQACEEHVMLVLVLFLHSGHQQQWPPLKVACELKAPSNSSSLRSQEVTLSKRDEGRKPWACEHWNSLIPGGLQPADFSVSSTIFLFCILYNFGSLTSALKCGLLDSSPLISVPAYAYAKF